jgi:enoyl-[acyl-carrier-protein] reductase (NADH)
MSDLEKHHVEHLDTKDGRELSATNSEDNILAEFSDEEIRSVKHRVDRRLVTTVGFMYCISLMDRTNLSAAAIAGMTAELKLNILMGEISRYSVVTLVFFATYVVFQFPSTIVIRFLGPRNHLAGITLMWGAVMIGMWLQTAYPYLLQFLAISQGFEQLSSLLRYAQSN